MSNKLLLILPLLFVGCSTHLKKDKSSDTSEACNTYKDMSTDMPEVRIIDPVDYPDCYITLNKPIILDDLEGCVKIEYDISKEGIVTTFNVTQFFLKNDSLNLRMNYDATTTYAQQNSRLIDSIRGVLNNQVRDFEVHRNDSFQCDNQSRIGMMYRVYNSKKHNNF